MTPEEIFKYHYGTIQNPVTPIPVEYGRLNRLVVWELSRNNTGSLFGVTCLDVRSDTSSFYNDELSDVFYSEKDARDYLGRLTETIGFTGLVQ